MTCDYWAHDPASNAIKQH